MRWLFPYIDVHFSSRWMNFIWTSHFSAGFNIIRAEERLFLLVPVSILRS